MVDAAKMGGGGVGAASVAVIIAAVGCERLLVGNGLCVESAWMQR